MMLVAVRSGRVQLRDSKYGAWRSAVEKHRVTGPVQVHDEGIAGDEHADRKHHGGPDKAILAYCADHYALWRDELGLPHFGPGAVGENLEVTGQSEAQVCIGDTYQFGLQVILQVSQPRQPCWKPAWLNGLPDFTTQMAQTGRTGWYLRVMHPGTMDPPCQLELLERPHPDWSVDRANRLIHHAAEDPKLRLELAALPELAASWQQMLRKQE